MSFDIAQYGTEPIPIEIVKPIEMLPADRRLVVREQTLAAIVATRAADDASPDRLLSAATDEGRMGAAQGKPVFRVTLDRTGTKTHYGWFPVGLGVQMWLDPKGPEASLRAEERLQRERNARDILAERRDEHARDQKRQRDEHEATIHNLWRGWGSSAPEIRGLFTLAREHKQAPLLVAIARAIATEHARIARMTDEERKAEKMPDDVRKALELPDFVPTPFQE